MNTIYVITGPAGVGKSTISEQVAKSLEKSCLIEGDALYSIVVGGYISPWKKGNHLKLLWKNVFSVIENCLKSEYDVVFNYIISNEDIETMKNLFPDANIRFVVLLADEETILSRDKMRPRKCRMGKRCLVLLNEFKNENYDAKYLLDTSKLSVNEILQKVLEDCRFGM